MTKGNGIRPCTVVVLRDCDCNTSQAVEESKRQPSDEGVRAAVEIKKKLRKQHNPFGLVFAVPTLCAVRTAGIISGFDATEITQRHINGGEDTWNHLQAEISKQDPKHVLVVCHSNSVKAIGQAVFADMPAAVERLRNMTLTQCQGFGVTIRENGQKKFSLLQ